MDEDTKNGADTNSTSEESQQDTQNQETSDTKNNSQDFDFGKERERLQGGSKYSPRDKAIHSAKGILAELQKHGVDPSDIFGGKTTKAEEETPDKKQQGSLTREEIEKVIDERVSKERQALREPLLNAKITPIVRSKEEGEVVKHWANVIESQVDNLDEAVEIGWIIANRHRFKDTFAEMARSKKADGTAGDGHGGAGQKKTVAKTEPTGREAEFAKSRGLVWDGDQGRFISPARKKHVEQVKKRS